MSDYVKSPSTAQGTAQGSAQGSAQHGLSKTGNKANGAKKAKKIGKLIYLGLIILFLYLPIGTLMVLSFNEGKSMSA